MSNIEMFQKDWSESTYDRNFDIISREMHIVRATARDNFYIPCAVCGEEFYIQQNSDMTSICPKCAKAVMKMRSMMTEEELNG